MADPLFTNIYYRYFLKAERWLFSEFQTIHGFVISTLVVFIVGLNLFSRFVYSYVEFYIEPIDVRIKYLSLIFLYLLIVFLLFQKVKYPINPKNKIGIFLAISDRYNEKESRLFIKKIHLEIEEALRNMGFGNIFNVINLDEHKSKKIIEGGRNFINPKVRKSVWGVNLNKSRWSFLLFGYVKQASKHNKKYFKIEPQYAVRHRTILSAVSGFMGKDFSEFMKSQTWEFPISEEMMALEVVSINIKENVLYSLGVSAFVSGALGVAVDFHEKLFDLIQPRIGKEKHLTKLHFKLKKLLAEAHYRLGSFYFQRFKIDLAISHLEKATKFRDNFYSAHLNLATLYYEKGKAYIDKVYEYLDLAEKNPQDASFKLSKAFLLIEQDKKYKEGTDLYINALRRGAIPDYTINATIDFLKRRELNYPAPYLKFIIALIHHFRKNKLESKKLFEEFVSENDENNELQYLIGKSKTYLLEKVSENTPYLKENEVAKNIIKRWSKSLFARIKNTLTHLYK